MTPCSSASEIRGALTWSADGEYTLCTSHPLVRRYLKESVQGLFKAMPNLQGVALIIGGEGFYHCHMRPYGVAKGHTNCAVARSSAPKRRLPDLCNDLASAARGSTGCRGRPLALLGRACLGRRFCRDRLPRQTQTGYGATHRNRKIGNHHQAERHSKKHLGLQYRLHWPGHWRTKQQIAACGEAPHPGVLEE